MIRVVGTVDAQDLMVEYSRRIFMSQRPKERALIHSDLRSPSRVSKDCRGSSSCYAHPPPEMRGTQPYAAIATRAVRYSARGLLPQRRVVESVADRDPGGRARRRRAQGAALADRSGAARQAIRARAARGGAADQCRGRGRRADLLRELWGRRRRQARRRAGRCARAGAGERPFLGGARLDDARARVALHRRRRGAAGRRGLDRGAPRRDRAARRAPGRARLDLVRALVRRRDRRHGARRRRAARPGGDAPDRRHPRRRRDGDRRRAARSRLSRLPHLQVAARALRARLPLRRQAPAGRHAARADSYGRRAITSERETYYRDVAFVAGASRFDMGERDHFISLEMASIGMELIAQWGRDAVAARLAALTARLADALRDCGVGIPDAAVRAPHILSLRFAGGMPDGLVERLAAEQVYVAPRVGRLRVSPHVYNDEDDVDRFVAAFRRLARA